MIPQDDSLDFLLGGLRAAADPSRLRLLSACAQGEWTVTELTQVLGQSQPRVSRHLKLLADAGLLERFREGSWVFYRRAQTGTGARLARSLCRLLPGDDPDLVLDRQRLAAVRAARQAGGDALLRGPGAELGSDPLALRRRRQGRGRSARACSRSSAPRNLLDIGTGTGRILQLFAAQIGFGLGVDLSREMLAVARANLDRTSLRNCQVRHGDMYHLPLPDGVVRGRDAAQGAALSPTIRPPRWPRRRACWRRAAGWWWSISRRTSSSSCAASTPIAASASPTRRSGVVRRGRPGGGPARPPRRRSAHRRDLVGPPLGRHRASAVPKAQRERRRMSAIVPDPLRRPPLRLAGRAAAAGRALVRVLPAEDARPAETRLWQTVEQLKPLAPRYRLGDLRCRRQSGGRHAAAGHGAARATPALPAAAASDLRERRPGARSRRSRAQLLRPPAFATSWRCAATGRRTASHDDRRPLPLRGRAGRGAAPDRRLRDQRRRLSRGPSRGAERRRRPRQSEAQGRCRRQPRDHPVLLRHRDGSCAFAIA